MLKKSPILPRRAPVGIFAEAQQLPLSLSSLRGGVRLLLVRLVHVCSESCMGTVAQKSEQLVGRTESNLLVGINFLHPSFKQALKWFCSRSESNYESSSHLIFEDLPWGDPSTLDLISAPARRREAAELTLLCTYRPVDVVLSNSSLEFEDQAACRAVWTNLRSSASTKTSRSRKRTSAKFGK
jgi:hypothetical protein